MPKKRAPRDFAAELQEAESILTEAALRARQISRLFDQFVDLFPGLHLSDFGVAIENNVHRLIGETRTTIRNHIAIKTSTHIN